MLAAQAASDAFEHQPIRLLDACNVDCIGMQPDAVDPRTFFVGEEATDLAEPDTSCLMLPTSSPMMQTSDVLLHQGSASMQPSWSFPSIPEHAELQMQPSLNNIKTDAFFASSPLSAVDPYFLALSNGTSPAPSTCSPTAAQAQYAAFKQDSMVPRVVSMPNLQIHPNPNALAHSGSTHDLRRHAILNKAAAMPRSKSASNVLDVSKMVEIPHIEYLTPPHLRKGKGGRQPAADPRLDPRIDAKKARRILANRLSAARSKLKQKSVMDALKQRVEMLRMQSEALNTEVASLNEACSSVEGEREVLKQQLAAAEEHLNLTKAMGRKLTEAQAAQNNFWAPTPLMI